MWLQLCMHPGVETRKSTLFSSPELPQTNSPIFWVSTPDHAHTLLIFGIKLVLYTLSYFPTTSTLRACKPCCILYRKASQTKIIFNLLRITLCGKWMLHKKKAGSRREREMKNEQLLSRFFPLFVSIIFPLSHSSPPPSKALKSRTCDDEHAKIFTRERKRINIKKVNLLWKIVLKWERKIDKDLQHESSMVLIK